MNITQRLTLMALITVGVLLVGPHKIRGQATEQVREEFHQSYALNQTGRIRLENIQGAVRIAVWDRNEVKVDAVKTAYTRELLNEAEIDIDSTPDSLLIKTRYPSGTLSFNSDANRRHQNPATVEYTLTVPRLARLSAIELVNGNLEIVGVAGDVNASSVNGRITARQLKGEVKLGTVNGNVEATFDRLDESKAVSLGSVNGNVVLVIPSDSHAILRASTVHGGIDNGFGLPVRRGDYVGRELYGQLGRGGTRVKLGNVNGHIDIRHAADGRVVSPATSLITVMEGKGKGTGKGSGKGTGKGQEPGGEDFDYDWQGEGDKAQQEAAAALREAQREAVRAQRDAERAQREAERAQKEAERAVAAAQREAARVAREAEQVARAAEREAAVAVRAAEAAAERESARAVREVEREVERVARVEAQAAVNVIYDGNYRLVERDTTVLDVSGTPRLNVETFDGTLLIRGWDKPQVNVNVIKRASNEQGLRGIRYQAAKNGNEINITATFDKAFEQNIAPGVTNINANVSLEIFVPRKVVLRAASGDGRVSLEGVAGELDLRTGDGTIDIIDGNGRVVAKTGDGRIRIARFNGAADATTGDGRINLEGHFTQLAARTGDGTITLALPADFDAYLETDAEKVLNEGALTVTEEPNPSGKRLRRWKIGRGGRVITLRTGDGNVILQRAN